MPSPFPGMDPFIEGQKWPDFHVRLVYELAAALTPSLRPQYTASIEERVYLEHTVDEPPLTRRPDVAILREPRREPAVTRPGGAIAIIEAPVRVPLPLREELRERFIEVRLRDSGQLVTVIEVLSPSNKRRGSDGRREYLEKRETVLKSDVHLLEIDLLRGGQRLPMGTELPSGDYFAILSRADRRPIADVWPIELRSALPVVPVPLAGNDPDVALDLQACFELAYERAGYDYALRYQAALEPPLGREETDWVRGRLER